MRNALTNISRTLVNASEQIFNIKYEVHLSTAISSYQLLSSLYAWLCYALAAMYALSAMYVYYKLHRLWSIVAVILQLHISIETSGNARATNTFASTATIAIERLMIALLPTMLMTTLPRQGAARWTPTGGQASDYLWRTCTLKRLFWNVYDAFIYSK